MVGGQNAKSAENRDVKGLTRDRPWLLPSNRKLRHLQGISLRNLELSKPDAQARGKTIDDASLPNALKTAAKALAQKEKNKLEHSRSSGDLKKAASGGAEEGVAKGKGKAIERPSAYSKLRRRSTLNWTNSTPLDRQQALEGATAERMADNWFSLHVDGVREPVYVSEVVEKSMNPSFRFFDLNTYGAFVTRRDELVMKYWAKTEGMTGYSLLIELHVNLRSLHFIGKTLEGFHHPLPKNAILFHLADGIYTSFTDLPPDEPAQTILPLAKPSQHIEPTSSFDALMRLSNLDDCVQDALSTREKLTTQINALLQEQQASRDAIAAASKAEETLALTNRSLAACQRQCNTARTRRSELQTKLAARRGAIASSQSSQKAATSQLSSARASLSTLHSTRQSTKKDLSGQIRRIGEDLSSIYPINPLHPGSLAFSILHLPLPNTNTHAEQQQHPDIAAAALGHTAQLTHLLSYYLSIPLPYPLSPHSSTSTIYDPISSTLPSTAARTFPLYQKGAVAYRFDYGVFLLNTDIELLMSKQGARMVDLRHTLGNLKYVLTVITEGKGEVPGRKRGRVRGLNGGLLGKGEEGSRESSIGSVVIRAGASEKKATTVGTDGSRRAGVASRGPNTGAAAAG